MKKKIVILPLVVLLSGCALFTGKTQSGRVLTPNERLGLADQTYQSVLKEVDDLIEQNVIKDQKTKDIVFYTAREGNRALKEARSLVSGDQTKFDYALGRVQSAITTLGSIKTNNKR